jgi:hopanoid biosynthesis associated RND transporter like protein HpnN
MEKTMEGLPVLMPWQSMFSTAQPSLRETRKFIVTQPVMDFKALSPGAAASKEVRLTAHELGLTPANGVSVRLTGSVALNDEEFASVAQGAELATFASFIMVMLLLFFALRSLRLIVPILMTLVVGLIATTAFALMAVGSLNLISVAFAVMFVGVAVDFGIQFGVRYREMRFNHEKHSDALCATASQVAEPLSLAALATAIGLLAFMPTDYRGVAELGVIAGAGMLIAFLLNITFLPALLTLFRPLAEPQSVGYKWATPADAFLVRERKKILTFLALLALAGLGLASQIRFDFDPLNLKDPKSESVATLFDIMKDPDATIYTIDILSPSLPEAQKLAAQIGALPEVDHTITLASFVPEDQDAKLALIEDAKFILEPSLLPAEIKTQPTPKEIYATLTKTSNALKSMGEERIEAKALARVLDAVIARNDDALLARLDGSMIGGIKRYLDQIRTLLSGTPAAIGDIDEALRRDWITPDGRAKIEVYPKGDARNTETLSAFVKAVRKIAPQATGTPVSIQESGKTVMGAFVEAGLFALLAIALLLLFTLKNIGDVFRVLAPLFLAGILTLATMVAISLPLNFANVIALPLLLSLGVSYAIYFVTYWRKGKNNPLSSGMARAVFFSAATTLVAFFSLSLSSHMGTRGMGQLLTIALLYCVACSFSLLPALLGRPPVR